VEQEQMKILFLNLDDKGSIPGRGWELISLPTRPHQLWGPPSLRCNGYRGSFRGVKRPDRESHHSPLRLAPRLRMREAIPPLTHTSSWLRT